MVKKRRLSQKLKQAANILSREEYGDFDPDFLENRVKRGKVTQEQIYKAVEHFGYRWKKGRWARVFPCWLETIISEENRRIISTW